jgi:HSP20 family protein
VAAGCNSDTRAGVNLAAGAATEASGAVPAARRELAFRLQKRSRTPARWSRACEGDPMLRYLRHQNGAWNPLLEIQRVQAQMNRLLDDLDGPDGHEFPPIGLWNGDEGLRLQALLPGFAPADIDVTVVGDTLTLKASRKGEEVDDGRAWHRRERRHGRFARTVQLPYEVDADKVKARYEDGVLEVELPRSPASKPRRVAVSTR